MFIKAFSVLPINKHSYLSVDSNISQVTDCHVKEKLK